MTAPPGTLHLLAPETPDSVLGEALATVLPSWTALKGCRLAGEGGQAPARLDYALLHPRVGIALVDLLPGSATPAAEQRLRRTLEAAGFGDRFGGLPPVAYLSLPEELLPELDVVLDQAFALRPPLALQGAPDWVGAAGQVLGGVPLGGAEAPPPAGPEDAEPPPTATPPAAVSPGLPEALVAGGGRQGRASLRPIAWFWSLVVLTLGAGAAVLHVLGPPEPAAGPAGAQSAMVAAAPQRATPPGMAATGRDTPAASTSAGGPAHAPPVPMPRPEGRRPEPPRAGTAGAPGTAVVPQKLAAASDPVLAGTEASPSGPAGEAWLAPPLPPSPNEAAADSSLSPVMIERLLRRGDAMVSLGDVSAARLLYFRAAGAGSSQAATALGKTYDPLFLASRGATGVKGDPATALAWYRHAAALGDSEAAALLARRVGGTTAE